MDEIKRLNYFTYQFLVEKDFKDEQAYHLGMRRRHNRALHTWGVAKGLHVTKASEKEVSISEGTAIDKDGREIVLLSDQPVDLTTLGTFGSEDSVYLSVSVEDVFDSADRYTSGGVDNHTRTTERAKFDGRTTAPPSDGSIVPLALVKLKAGNIDSIDESLRRNAGSVIAPESDLQVRSLRVSGPGDRSVEVSSTHALGSSTRLMAVTSNGITESQLQFKDRLGFVAPLGGSFIMTLLQNGNVGIGTTSPQRKLEVSGDVAGISFEGFAASPNAGAIRFGDKTGWKLHIGRSRESVNGVLNSGVTGVLMTVQDNGNVGIGTTSPSEGLDIQGGRLRVVNTQIYDNEINRYLNDNLYIGYRNTANTILQANGGNVGIGTREPKQKLSVSGSESTQHGLAAAIGVLNSAAGGRNWYLRAGATGTATPAGGFSIADDADYRLVIDSKGNVGIATTGPGFKLDVADRMRVRQGAAGTAGIWFFQTTPANERAFVGMANDNEVGFWGHTGAGWGLRMDTTTGNVVIRGSISAGGGKGGYVMDQFVNKLGEALEQGDVVVIGENQTSLYYGTNNNIPIPEVDLAQRIYDTSVCGIVSEVYTELRPEIGEEVNPGVKAKKTTGPVQAKVTTKRGKPQATPVQAFTPEELEKLDRTKIEPGQIGWMVTLGAYAHCKVDADIAPIKVGDLLTTSPTKGHAQKVLEPQKAVGAIIGKALGSLKKGKGKIPVLVMLQ